MPKVLATPEQEAKAAKALLSHLPMPEVLARYRRAKGNEIASGKFSSPESSAALAANTFGYFLTRPSDMSPLPGWTDDWNVKSVLLEAEVRFPWRGGLHPWLDAVIETDKHFVGVESKRYEPFRPHRNDGKPPFSAAYGRPVWGQRMQPYEWLRDGLAKQRSLFEHLDAVQLVKHAFGLRTQGHARGKAPVLAYAYAEPTAWPLPGGKAIPALDRAHHAEEVRWFARMAAGAEVRFIAFTYRDLLDAFAASALKDVREHGAIIRERFDC